MIISYKKKEKLLSAKSKSRGPTNIHTRGKQNKTGNDFIETLQSPKAVSRSIR